MWSTPTGHGLSHDRPCSNCGHAAHSYLPCSDTCACVPPSTPGGVTAPVLAGAL